MYTKQALQRHTILALLLVLSTALQPCLAQTTVSDSLLQSSRLYQKGKKNLSTGGIILGIGVAGTLVGIAMGEDESSSGWDFGPSDKEVVFFLSGIVGTIGLLKMIQGGVRMQNARAELGTVQYYKTPGQQARMPAISLHWPIPGNRITKTKTVSGFVVR